MVLSRRNVQKKIQQNRKVHLKVKVIYLFIIRLDYDDNVVATTVLRYIFKLRILLSSLPFLERGILYIATIITLNNASCTYNEAKEVHQYFIVKGLLLMDTYMFCHFLHNHRHPCRIYHHPSSSHQFHRLQPCVPVCTPSKHYFYSWTLHIVIIAVTISPGLAFVIITMPDRIITIIYLNYTIFISDHPIERKVTGLRGELTLELMGSFFMHLLLWIMIIHFGVHELCIFDFQL